MDSEDESLAHVGHAIFTLLDDIADFRTKPLDNSKASTLDLIINESDKFKIWSTSAGLLIKGHGSLDYRVREAESLSNVFHSFLSDLRQNFEEVITLGLQDDPVIQAEDSAAETDCESDDDSDDSDVMDILLETIKNIVDRLFSLATKLRSPETRLRTSRAQNFQIPGSDVDLFECFYDFEYDFVSSVFRDYRRGPKLADADESAASPHKDTKLQVDDEASEWLVRRIALANVARRRQFAYWQRHQLKLERHTEAAIAARKNVKPKEVIDASSAILKPITIDAASTLTISTATQLPNPAADFDDLISMASVSEYAPAKGVEHCCADNFPPSPHVAKGSKFFQCPYCFTTCTKKTLETRAWQAHLIHDLRPYVCTYEGCRTPGQLYDTRADWIGHENTSHATTWKCPVHPNQVFDDLVAFQLHAADRHIQNAVIKGNAQETVGAIAETKPDRLCPICTLSGLSKAQLNDHIAAHLERLAAFSFPKDAGTAEDDSGKGSQEVNGGDEKKSRDPDMESKLSFSSESHASLETPRAAEKTEQTYLQALARNEELLGPNHASTLNTVSNLGKWYYDQERFEDAELFYRRALAEQEKTLGSYDPKTLDSIYHLAKIYDHQRKFSEAESMYRIVEEGRKIVFGENDRKTLASIFDLGRIQRSQSKWSEAEETFRELAERQKVVLGEEDRKTLTSMHDLAFILHRLQRYSEADEILRVVIERRQRVLGEDHADTLTAIKDLAWGLNQESKYVEAEERARVAVERRKKVLSEDHADILWAMHDLFNAQRFQGRWPEAEKTCREMLQRQQRVLGEEHPDTLAMMQNLAFILHRLNKYSEADGVFREVLEGRKRVLGEEHPDTLTTTKDLAWGLNRQGRHAEAEETARVAVEGRKRVLGEDHPETLWATWDLVEAQRSQGKLSEAQSSQSKWLEAEDIFRKSLEKQKRELGEEHPSTLAGMHHLAVALRQKGKFSEAGEILRELVEKRKRVSGEGHPDTKNSVNLLASVLEQQQDRKS